MGWRKSVRERNRERERLRWRKSVRETEGEEERVRDLLKDVLVCGAYHDHWTGRLNTTMTNSRSEKTLIFHAFESCKSCDFCWRLCFTMDQGIFFSSTYSPNSALISAQRMAPLGFLPTTFCSNVIWTHVSRVAPDWDLWRILYWLSYSTLASWRWHIDIMNKDIVNYFKNTHIWKDLNIQ